MNPQRPAPLQLAAFLGIAFIHVDMVHLQKECGGKKGTVWLVCPWEASNASNTPSADALFRTIRVVAASRYLLTCTMVNVVLS